MVIFLKKKERQNLITLKHTKCCLHPKTHQIASFKQNFLGGACHEPPSNAHGYMQIPTTEKKIVSPPPLPNPGYAPVGQASYTYYTTRSSIIDCSKHRCSSIHPHVYPGPLIIGSRISLSIITPRVSGAMCLL